MKSILIVVLALGSFASGQVSSSPPTVDRGANALLEQDFVAFNPHYKQEREPRVERTKALAQRMFAAEAQGGKTTCGHQILFELESLLISSADFKLIDQRLHDLEASIGHPSSDKPDAGGMWGVCYQEWYFKLYATYDRLEARAGEDPAPHPLPAFLARFRRRRSLPPTWTRYPSPMFAIPESITSRNSTKPWPRFFKGLSVESRKTTRSIPSCGMLFWTGCCSVIGVRKQVSGENATAATAEKIFPTT